MSRLADIYARVTPRLAHRRGSTLPTRAHAWILRRSGGRFGRRFLGAPVLVLRTTGRRSGQLRESPVFYVRHGESWAVVASNAGSPRPPAWFLNVEAKADAELLAEGGWHDVRARRATADEERELWPRFIDIYRGYDHYKQVTTRELPVVMLEPRG